jgi:NadR type nicotinamide-nucleotide adenylyltransferase
MSTQINIKKIVVIGPESTGKSALCAQLSAHYETLWCPEYARSYLVDKGINYNYEDLLEIAKGQIQLEDEIYFQLQTQQKNRPYFIDTDMQVMKVWSEYVFENCHRYILNQIAERNYDAYLLCTPDIPWEADALREYPDEVTRVKLFHYYKDALTHQSLPWIEIAGDYAARLEKAVRFTDEILIA